MASKALDIPGPAGRLEAVLLAPDGEPVAAAILCHAHPLRGGSMHFRLLFRLSRLLREKRFAVLRFHFRGVGRSEGEHDEGRGEQEDAGAALDHLAESYPEKPILLGGFSFGASIALRVGLAEDRVRSILALGLPVSYWRGREVSNPAGKPVLFVQGEHDEFGDAGAIRDFVGSFPGPSELAIVRGGDHLFTDRIPEVERAVSEWLERLSGNLGLV
jgi:alpha/beta superfamily hydrolase